VKSFGTQLTNMPEHGDLGFSMLVINFLASFGRGIYKDGDTKLESKIC
jgi:hypothetical protein